MPSNDALLEGLPGAEFIREGLADFAAGRATVPAWLVAIAHPRLRRAGLLPAGPPPPPEPELALYALLREQGGDAYGRYNAWLRRLVSLEHALEGRVRAAERVAQAGHHAEAP